MERVIRLIFLYLYLKAGNLSNTPHDISLVQRLGNVASSLRVPPAYGQSSCSVHGNSPPVDIEDKAHSPLSASSSLLHPAIHFDDSVHAQNPFDVVYEPRTRVAVLCDSV